jgi:hypothetical protein
LLYCFFVLFYTPSALCCFKQGVIRMHQSFVENPIFIASFTEVAPLTDLPCGSRVFS